jgi:hypothetical protein
MMAVGFSDVRRYALTGLARPFGIAFVGRAPDRLGNEELRMGSPV